MQTVTVGVEAGPSGALDQGSMIDVRPLPEEDANTKVEFKLVSKGTPAFILLGLLVLIVGIVVPLVLSSDADAQTNLKQVGNAFIAIGIIIFLVACVIYSKLVHTDEIIITETRYVRKIGTSCDLRCVNFRLSSNQTQYNMDFLTGVELRTSTDNSPLYTATISLIVAIALAFILPPTSSIYPAVVIAILVVGVLFFPLYFLTAVRGRQAFVRFSFSSGLQPESEGGEPFERLISFWKRIVFRYPVFEDSIVLPLDAGGQLYQTLSSLRLRAAARLAKL